MLTKEDVLKADRTLIHLARDLYRPNIFLERMRKQTHYEQVLEDIINGKITMKYKL